MNKLEYDKEDEIISNNMHQGIVESLIFLVISVSFLFMTWVIIYIWLRPTDFEMAQILLYEKFILDFMILALWFVSWVLVYYMMQYGFILTSNEFVFGVSDSRYIYKLKLKDIKGYCESPFKFSSNRREILIYDQNDCFYGPIRSYSSKINKIQNYFIEKNKDITKPTRKEYIQKVKEVKQRRKEGDSLSVVKKPYFYEVLLKKLPLIMFFGTVIEVFVKKIL